MTPAIRKALRAAIGQRVTLTAGLIYGAQGTLILSEIQGGIATLTFKNCPRERVPVSRISMVTVHPAQLAGVQGAR